MILLIVKKVDGKPAIAGSFNQPGIALRRFEETGDQGSQRRLWKGVQTNMRRAGWPPGMEEAPTAANRLPKHERAGIMPRKYDVWDEPEIRKRYENG